MNIPELYVMYAHGLTAIKTYGLYENSLTIYLHVSVKVLIIFLKSIKLLTI